MCCPCALTRNQQNPDHGLHYQQGQVLQQINHEENRWRRKLWITRGWQDKSTFLKNAKLEYLETYKWVIERWRNSREWLPKVRTVIAVVGKEEVHKGLLSGWQISISWPEWWLQGVPLIIYWALHLFCVIYYILFFTKKVLKGKTWKYDKMFIISSSGCLCKSVYYSLNFLFFKYFKFKEFKQFLLMLELGVRRSFLLSYVNWLPYAGITFTTVIYTNPWKVVADIPAFLRMTRDYPLPI